MDGEARGRGARIRLWLGWARGACRKSLNRARVWRDLETAMSTVHDFAATTLEGREKPLSDFSGQVLLVVNTASKCDFTPQYKGLEALYRKYHAQDFVVLGFPCNQFGAQEPGDAAEIARFCSRTYDVTFPMFGKIDVNGAGAHPLYRFLRGEAKGVMGTGAIKWNFTKFLVDRKGGVAARFAPAAAPKGLEKEIEKLLRAGRPACCRPKY
jgi:glutathione peroxidase